MGLNKIFLMYFIHMIFENCIIFCSWMQNINGHCAEISNQENSIRTVGHTETADQGNSITSDVYLEPVYDESTVDKPLIFDVTSVGLEEAI